MRLFSLFLLTNLATVFFDVINSTAADIQKNLRIYNTNNNVRILDDGSPNFLINSPVPESIEEEDLGGSVDENNNEQGDENDGNDNENDTGDEGTDIEKGTEEGEDEKEGNEDEGEGYIDSSDPENDFFNDSGGSDDPSGDNKGEEGGISDGDVAGSDQSTDDLSGGESKGDEDNAFALNGDGDGDGDGDVEGDVEGEGGDGDGDGEGEGDGDGDGDGDGEGIDNDNDNDDPAPAPAPDDDLDNNDFSDEGTAPVGSPVASPVGTSFDSLVDSTDSSFDNPVDSPVYSPVESSVDSPEEDVNQDSVPAVFPPSSSFNNDETSNPTYTTPTYFPTKLKPDTSWDTPTYDLPTPTYETPKPRPTATYVSTDDDPIKNDVLDEDVMDSSQEWGWNDSTVEEMEHDRTVIIALSIIFGVMFFFSIFIAYQLLENPDGCCASLCRISVACVSGVVRCVCYPCRALCGCTGQSHVRHSMISNDDGHFTHDLELS